MRMPQRLLRLCMDVAVTMRSPMPASPPNVYSAQPIFSPRRLISAMPRVMRAARALSPLPSPLEMPTAERLDVLHRAAQLHAEHVRVRIGAHTGVHEHVLHLFRDLHVRTGGNDGRGHIERDFLRVGRAGQRNELHMVMLPVLAQFVADDFGSWS